MSKRPKQPKPFSKPEEIFLQAEAFRNASDVTHKNSLKYHHNGNEKFGNLVSTAAFVNHAFACELYFKCLAVIERNEYKPGHDLLDLFDFLSQQTRDELIKRCDVDVIHGPAAMIAYNNKPPTLVELLTEAATYFPDMRYQFETGRYMNFGLSFEISLIRKYILELRPDFEKLIQTQ